MLQNLTCHPRLSAAKQREGKGTQVGRLFRCGRGDEIRQMGLNAPCYQGPLTITKLPLRSAEDDTLALTPQRLIWLGCKLGTLWIAEITEAEGCCVIAVMPFWPME